MMINAVSFANAVETLDMHMKYKSERVKPSRWQSIDVRDNPAAEMHELRWIHLHLEIGGSVDYYRRIVKPDLPWADEHFAERVEGFPYNPQPSEATWPHGDGSNKAFRNEGERHSHTYSERFWPKWAGKEGVVMDRPILYSSSDTPNVGIRYRYGDLGDVVTLMSEEPDTRQAVLPVWFPEDTGVAHRGRKPCSLHYHFYRNGQYVDMEYSIRSCDYYRHFRNDVYFAIRLLMWMIDECRKASPKNWTGAMPGKLVMNIGSLHLFRNDYIKMFGSNT